MSLKQHKFDEGIRLTAVLALLAFAAILVVSHSPLARDVVLLVVGMVSGHYLNRGKMQA